MITSKVYNQKGKEVGSVNLPEAVFGLPWNADLVHQVVTSMKTSARVPYAHVKERGEVRGGGKKPWQQKGLGRARHGSTRSPIWVGGGVAHGPRNEKNFERIVSKKMRAKALYTVLSKKFKDGEILFVDTFSFSAPKTKDGKEVLGSLAGVKGFEIIMKKKSNAALIALHAKNPNTEKSLRNFSHIHIGEFRNLNPVEALERKIIVIENPEEAVSFLSKKMGDKKVVPIHTVKTTHTKASKAIKNVKPKAKVAKIALKK